MTDYVSCDVSEFQPPVNDTYPHQWLSFRVCDGDYIDKNVGLNLSWALHARASGKLAGFTVYVVYRPFKNSIILSNLDRLGVPRDCVVMIDAETWGGQITGDHSTELNQLASALAARQGSQQRVWGYGNRGDLATLWSGRPAWLGVVVASYGGTKPSIPGQVGWQYTDGQWNVPGLPSSSPPFGPCDHNVFTVQTAPTSPPAPHPLEDDMFVMVMVDKADCTAQKVQWPGVFLCDGEKLSHVSSRADVAAWLAVGIKYDPTHPITVQQFRELGGQTQAAV